MRILIVKLSSIGDVVHTLPAVAALRRALPSAKLVWVVERRASAILKGSPVIDELIEVDTRAWRSRMISGATISDIGARLNEIRGGSNLNGASGFDIAIDFQGLIKSAVVARASAAARRIGFETADLREKASRFFLTEQVQTADLLHVIEKNLALARSALSTPDERACFSESAGAYEFPFSISREDEQYVETAIGSNDRFAIINPGGGWPTKLWPAERFGRAADWLWQERGIASFITYGPGEESLAGTVRASSASNAARVLPSSLKQFIALARRARIFVGGDTGPLHLAAACGTPLVGIYGPTSPERNGPFNKHDITVGRDLWCRADCHRRSCWHWECMDIPVETVTRAMAARLEKIAEQ